MGENVWRGEQECSNKVSLFRGPVLLTYDRRFNAMDPADLPRLDAADLRGKLVAVEGTIVALDFAAGDGSALRLCDFASAGEGGSPYRSWLRVDHVAKTTFSHHNPLRSGR